MPPDVSSLAAASKIREEKSWFRIWLDKLTDFLNIFDPPQEVRKSVWCQPACGFLLTLMYLLGVVALIVFDTVKDDGRSSEVDIRYVSPEKIKDGSMVDFFCLCDLPAQVHSYTKDDPDAEANRTKQFNRCYSTDEVQDIDVLQFGDDTEVGNLINGTERTPYEKTFNSSYTLRWKSYELTGRNGDLFDISPTHGAISNLSQQLDMLGYVGEDGVISLKDLAERAFFTVPQGFIRADVNYNCTNCTACRKLWADYDVDQAAPQPINSSIWEKDNGWKFCYQTFGDLVGDDGVCQGACRFFPTLHQPWGIAMHKFSKELQTYIRDPDGTSTQVIFRSRLMYAFVEEFGTGNETYQLRFMDVQRSDVVWAEILRVYPDIPSCADSNVTYCNGTDICQAAAIYSDGDTTGKYCIHKDNKKGDSRKQCEAIKEELGSELEFRDKNETRLERLCDNFVCQTVQSSSQITWNGNELVGGEIALSRLIFNPSVLSGYRPALCTNEYHKVFLKHNETSDPKRLLSIHEMECSNMTNVQGCWMTGRYKNVTDSSWDPWREYNFTDGEKMFVCYRFHKESHFSYMYDKFGVVSGLIGSWLLVLSCVFWVVIKTNMPATVEDLWVPSKVPETSDRPQIQMSEINTGPDETQWHNDENDNTSEQSPVKQKTSYERLPKLR